MFGQNVCLDKIPDEFEFGSPGVKHQVKLKKYLVGALEANSPCSIHLKIGQNVCLNLGLVRVWVTCGHKLGQ